jgi:hypothetical protein
MKNKGKLIISSVLDKCTSQLLGFWTLSIIWNYRYRKTQRFENWICFRPQVRRWGETPTLLGPLKRANLNHWVTETDPVSETSCFLVFRFGTMDKVRKPSNSERYTPLSESFRLYLQMYLCISS